MTVRHLYSHGRFATADSHLVRASFRFSAKLTVIMSRRIPVLLVATAAVFLIIQKAPAADTAPVNSAPAQLTMPVSGPASNAPISMTMQKSQENPSQVGDHSSFSSVHVEGPYIAMTFDDGPHAILTPKLLDILKQRHIHATFFVLGQLVKEHPEIVERAVAEGIANHSWDHKALNKLGEGGLQHELADTSAAIKDAVGKAPTLMRPPYGATNPRLSRAIEKEYGMKVILWSVDPDDWKDPGPQAVEQRIVSGWKGSGGAKPGAIILSHDIHKGTVEAMPATLDTLLAKGYQFVTVSELLAMENKIPATNSLPAASKADTLKAATQ